MHIILLVTLLFANATFGQKKCVFKLKADSVYNVQSKNYRSGNFEEYIEIQNSKIEHYANHGPKDSLFKAQIGLADVSRATKNYNYAVQLSLQLLREIPWEKRNLRSNVYVVLASTYYETNYPIKAIDASKRAIHLAEIVRNNKVLGNSYNIVGAAYREINLDSSLKYTKLAIHQFKISKDSAHLALAYYNVANSMQVQNKIDSSLHYSELALELANKFGILPYQTLIINNQIGCYVHKKQFKKVFYLINKRDSINRVIDLKSSTEKVTKLIHEIEQTDAEKHLEAMQEIIALNHELNKRKNALIVLIGSILILLTVVLVIIFRNHNNRKNDLDKLAELNKSVSNYSNELTELNANKDKILSIIGHDLRSPFNQLISYLSYAEEGDLTLEEQKNINKAILLNARNGLHMLDNLLLWANSQKEGIRINPQKFLVAESLNQVLEQVKFLATNKSIEVNISCFENLKLFADKVLFEIVVRNLLSNALKFSPKNSEVLIDADIIDGEITINITDRGEGMPHSIIQSVKNRQLDYKSTLGTLGEKGAGMGLYLTVEFAQRNEGRIEFYKLSVGTLAKFSLPQRIKP